MKRRGDRNDDTPARRLHAGYRRRASWRVGADLAREDATLSDAVFGDVPKVKLERVK